MILRETATIPDKDAGSFTAEQDASAGERQDRREVARGFLVGANLLESAAVEDQKSFAGSCNPEQHLAWIGTGAGGHRNQRRRRKFHSGAVSSGNRTVRVVSQQSGGSAQIQSRAKQSDVAELRR